MRAAGRQTGLQANPSKDLADVGEAALWDDDPAAKLRSGLTQFDKPR
jgi:hypothetical protein